MASGDKIAAGVTSQAAFVLETGELRSPATVTSGKRLRLKSTSLGIRPQTSRLNVANVVGNLLHVKDVNASGDLTIAPSYGDIALICAALGSGRFSDYPVAEGGAYRHIFEPDFQFADRQSSLIEHNPVQTIRRRGSLYIHNGAGMFEYVSAFISGLRLNYTPQQVSMSFSVTALRPQVNEATTAPTWTFPGESVMEPDQAEIYFVPRDVFTTNGTFAVTDSGGTKSVSLSGTMTGGQIAEELEKQFNESSLAGYYQVRWHGAVRRFTIGSTVSFSLATSTLKAKFGFDSAQSGYSISSKYFAQTDIVAAFATGNRICVSQLSASLNNSFRIESTGEFIAMPSGGEMSGQVTINIPRLPQPGFPDNIANLARHGDTFAVMIRFTGGELGGGGNEETFQIVLPNCVVTNAASPVSGQQVSATTLSLQAGGIASAEPNIDFVSGFHYNELAMSSAVSCLGVFDGYLWYFRSGGHLGRTNLHSNTASYATLAKTGSAIIGHRRKLYLGTTDGNVYRLDGTTLTNTSVGGSATSIHAMAVYEGNLYALQRDGKLHVYNGSSWTQLIDYGTAYGLVAFDGYLWIMAGGNVYRYDGSSFTTSTTGFGSNEGHLIAYDNQLWAAAGSVFKRLRETSWETLSLSLSHARMTAFLGWIVFVVDGGTVLRFYHPVTGNTYAINAPNADESSNVPVVYDNHLIIPTDGGSLNILSAPRPYRVEMVNTINTSPI